MGLYNRFVDGTLASGANNGIDWENAYQGVAGLQTAVDSCSSGHSYRVLMRNTFTLTTQIDLDVWVGYGYGNRFLQLIGCTNTDSGANWTPLPLGQYLSIDASSIAILKHSFYVLTDLEGHEFHNLRIHSNPNSGYAAVKYWNTSSGSRYGGLYYNCKIDSNDYGIYGPVTPGRMFNIDIDFCTFQDNTTKDIAQDPSNIYFIIERITNSYIKHAGVSGVATVEPSTSYAPVVIQDSIFHNTGHDLAIFLSSRLTGTMRGNIFYGAQAYKGVFLAGGWGRGHLVNNIFWVNDTSVAPIDLAGGASVYTCKYNATNSEHADPYGLLTSDRVPNYDTNIALASDPFVDAAGGDFTPRNVQILRGGMPDLNGNFTSMGPIQVPGRLSKCSRSFNPGRVSIIR